MSVIKVFSIAILFVSLRFGAIPVKDLKICVTTKCNKQPNVLLPDFETE